jgi:hypothetical protein
MNLSLISGCEMSIFLYLLQETVNPWLSHTHTHTQIVISNLFRGKGVDVFDTLE